LIIKEANRYILDKNDKLVGIHTYIAFLVVSPELEQEDCFQRFVHSKPFAILIRELFP
jgi:hypothetical protein